MLIDQGSELTFISENLVQRYKLKRKAASVPLREVGGTSIGRTKGIVSIYLLSKYDPSLSCSLDAYVLPRLMTELPQNDTNSQLWPHVKGLQLADPKFYQSGLIHIILGADAYGAIIMPGLARGDTSSPIAQQTIIGWVLSGQILSDRSLSSSKIYHCSPDYELQELLTRFWKQEEYSTAIESSS